MKTLLAPTFLDDASRLAANTFLDISTRGTLLLLFAGAVCLLGRRLAATDRHRIWFLALLSLVALPFVAPFHRVADKELSDVSSTPGFQYDLALNLAPVTVGVPPGGISTGSWAMSRAGKNWELSLNPLTPPRVTRPTDPRSQSVLSIPPDSFLASTQAPSPDGFAVAITSRWARILAAVWLAIALVFLALIALGLRPLAKLRRNAKPLRDPHWNDDLARLAREFGIRRSVRLLQRPGDGIPLTWGTWRPVILLPDTASHWSEERRRAVLSHELGHIRRWDCLTQQIADVLRALLWFHPLVWLAAHRMRLEREFACDDLVLGAGWKASDYADHLLDLARSRAAIPVHGALAMAHPARLGARVTAIVDPSRRRRPMTPLLFASVTLLILLGGGFLPRPLSMVQAAEAPAGGVAPEPRPDMETREARSEAGFQRLRDAIAKQQEEVNRMSRELDKIREAHGITDMALEGQVGMPEIYSSQRLEGLRDDLRSRRANRLAKLEQLRTLERDALLNVLLTTHPEDRLLQHLSIAHADADVELEALKSTHGDAHPEVIRARKVLELLTAKLDDRIKGILRAMESELAAIAEELSYLEKASYSARSQMDDNAKAHREFFEAKRRLENERLMLDVLNRKIAQELFDGSLLRRPRNPDILDLLEPPQTR